MSTSKENIEEKGDSIAATSASNSLSRNYDSDGDQNEKKKEENKDVGAIKKQQQQHQQQSEVAADVAVAASTSQYPPNMMAEASWWSRLIFYWPYPLLKLGLERPLVDSDIPEILKTDSSRYNREYLGELWKKEQERCRRRNNSNIKKMGTPPPPQIMPSLHRAILVDFFRSIWYIQPIMCIAAVAKIVQAVYLGNLIESFEDGGENGYAFAGAIVLCGLVVLIEHRKYNIVM